MPRLPRSFYTCSTIKVAQDLLGHFLVRRLSNGKALKGIIVETEAYCGESDPACHAAKGKTPRNEIMYGPAGHAYVYFIYGMYFCLNIVTEGEDYPAAVLIRGVIPVVGLEAMKRNRKGSENIADGPGKLCQALKITKSLNGDDLVRGRKLWVEKNDQRKQDLKIKKTPRIGIPVGVSKPWRFVLS